MKNESVQTLQEKTEVFRVKVHGNGGYFIPNKNDERIPKSVLKYNPLIWEADEGIWHALLGSGMPE